LDDVHFLGRAREVLLVGHCHEVLELSKVQDPLLEKIHQ
jgi:hypothetical protein